MHWQVTLPGQNGGENCQTGNISVAQPCTEGFVCDKRVVVDPIERNESIALRREQYFTTMSENGFLSESRGRYGRFLADKTSFLLTQRLHVEWTGAIETPVSGNLGDSENKRQAFLTLFQSFACRCQSAGNWGTQGCKFAKKSLLWFGMSLGVEFTQRFANKYILSSAYFSLRG